MAHILSRHSKEKGCEVYHNNGDCMEGNNIESKYLVYGTGNKRLCCRCKELDVKEADYQNSLHYLMTKRFENDFFAITIICTSKK